MQQFQFARSSGVHESAQRFARQRDIMTGDGDRNCAAADSIDHFQESRPHIHFRVPGIGPLAFYDTDTYSPLTGDSRVFNAPQPTARYSATEMAIVSERTLN